MALGAEARGVRRMVVLEGSRVVAVGVVLGVGVGLAATRILSGILYGVETADPVTFAAVATVMLAVGMLASYVPARRASSVDPVEAIREG